MIGCLRKRVHKRPIIALYFEFENELKFYNLGACLQEGLNKRKSEIRQMIRRVLEVFRYQFTGV